MSALVAVTLHGDQVVAYVVAAAGFLGAAGYLWRKGRHAMRVLDAAAAVVHRELNHNHGGSIKDDTYATAVVLAGLSRLVDDIDERLTAHLDDTDGRNER